jgi:hypothetical protein
MQGSHDVTIKLRALLSNGQQIYRSMMTSKKKDRAKESDPVRTNFGKE